jgi:hypothetical protein
MRLMYKTCSLLYHFVFTYVPQQRAGYHLVQLMLVVPWLDSIRWNVELVSQEYICAQFVPLWEVSAVAKEIFKRFRYVHDNIYEEWIIHDIWLVDAKIKSLVRSAPSVFIMTQVHVNNQKPKCSRPRVANVLSWICNCW